MCCRWSAPGWPPGRGEKPEKPAGPQVVAFGTAIGVVLFWPAHA